MTETRSLGPWLRRFLEEHLVSERNLARNTRRSYRDAFVLLLPFAARQAHKSIDRLAVRDLTPECIRSFLAHVEEERGCARQTRNQRLHAIRAFARYVALRSPENVEWYAQIRGIPLKKTAPTPVRYLEKPELDALLNAADTSTPTGRREHTLLLFLYTTGARASEAAKLTVGDLQLEGSGPGHSLVKLQGKGGKTRLCPLLTDTARAIAELVKGRDSSEPVFLNRRNQAITRSGIRQLVGRCAARAVAEQPSLAAKRVSPHVLRHTAATHLLRSKVDLHTIGAWLGHARLETTAVYAKLDLETKARAIAALVTDASDSDKPWKDDEDVIAYLRTLR